MELNDLKSGWQNAGGTLKSENELFRMTKNHPSTKKIKFKLIAETIGLTFFLLVYYDWFDGDKKSFFVNALLVSSLLLYILNDVMGYLSIEKPVMGLNLKLSIQNYSKRIKQLATCSVIVSVLYSISFLFFFTSVIEFTREKSLMLLFLVIVLVQMMFFSFRIWSRWIKNLEKQLEDF